MTASPPPCELEDFGQVVVTENVHKVAALLHFPTLFNGAEGALVKLAFLSCHLECHVPEKSPGASVV